MHYGFGAILFDRPPRDTTRMRWRMYLVWSCLRSSAL